MDILTIISAVFVLSGLLAALTIAVDLRRRPQPMKIMNSVWILTALWAGPLGAVAYFGFGRQKAEEAKSPSELPHHMELKMPDRPIQHNSMRGMSGMTMKMPDRSGAAGTGGMAEMTMKEMPQRPKWQSAVLSTLHCGAGCTLADLAGEWFAWLVPISIGGSLIAGSWTLDYILALLFGIGFQYVAIRDMQRITSSEALTKAAKADVLSLTAWQVGMYGWMAVVFFVLFSHDVLPRTGWTFWFMMQIAMLCGFLVALPMNRFLIKKGIKQGM